MSGICAGNFLKIDYFTLKEYNIIVRINKRRFDMAKCAIKLGLILVFIFLYCVPSFSEDITITTYYPSPYGSYNELEVRKRIRIKGDADGDGAITYNDSRHIVDIVAGTTRHDIYNEATP